MAMEDIISLDDCSQLQELTSSLPRKVSDLRFNS